MRSRARQHGAVLLIGLLLLALLMLLISTAWSESRWLARVTTQDLADSRAETAARSSLAWAENWLFSQMPETRTQPCWGECIGAAVLARGSIPRDASTLPERWWLDHAWVDGSDPASGNVFPGRSASGFPAGRWIVEESHFEAAGTTAPDSPAVSYYRILARAPRVPSGKPVLIEAIIARPWGDETWNDRLHGETSRFCHDVNAPPRCGRLSWRRIQ